MLQYAFAESHPFSNMRQQVLCCSLPLHHFWPGGCHSACEPVGEEGDQPRIYQAVCVLGPCEVEVLVGRLLVPGGDSVGRESLPQELHVPGVGELVAAPADEHQRDGDSGQVVARRAPLPVRVLVARAPLPEPPPAAGAVVVLEELGLPPPHALRPVRHVLDARAGGGVGEVERQPRRVHVLRAVPADHPDRVAARREEEVAQPRPRVVVDFPGREELLRSERFEHLFGVKLGHGSDRRRGDEGGERYRRQKNRGGDLGGQPRVLGHGRKQHGGPLRMPDVSDGGRPRGIEHVADHRGEVLGGHVVPREVPELLRAGRKSRVVAAEGVAADVAHPDVEARIGEHEPEALGGAVVHPAGAAVEQGVLKQHGRPRAPVLEDSLLDFLEHLLLVCFTGCTRVR
mmetsp:Transcript_5953/g.14448  ORF Transcript_5953/g.14448 Transcript_5953/m.14448 type:complete len:400 (+) Transcript_5953:110-1309(+)